MELFFTFAKIGALAFGGGLSMLPSLNYEIVSKRGWATEQELIDFYAVGQCTPGIIAVNIATFIGYKRKKIFGAIVATLGMILPSIVIILIIAAVLQNIMKLSIVMDALKGIQGAVCALMLDIILVMGKKNIHSKRALVLAIGAFVITFFFQVSPIWVVVIAVILGILQNKKNTKASKGEAK